MKTYRAYLAEIQRLQAKADAARRRELKGVIAHIRELIVKHGLTREDLDLIGEPPRGRPAKAAKKSVGVARYRDPVSGKTWTGRGKPPAWIAGAKDRSAFAIGAAAPAEAPDRKVGAKAAKAAKKSAGRRAATKRLARPQAVASQKRATKKGAAKKSTKTALTKVAKKPVGKKPVAKKAAAKAPVRRAAKATKPPVVAPAPAPAPTENAG